MWSVLLNDPEDIFTKKRYIWDFTPRKELTVLGIYPHRIDLLSRDTLSAKNLWWVIAEANNIIFPFDEITFGIKLLQVSVSSPETLRSLLTDSTLVTEEL